MANQRKKTSMKKVTKKAASKPTGKHPGGRPTKYSNDTLIFARDYLNHYEKHGDQIPSIAGLAVILGVRRETLHVWAKEEGKEEFSNILGEILATQEKVLISKGLTGDFNPTIVKLILGKHAYHDRRDNTITGLDGGPVKVLNADIKNLSPKEAERAYHDFAKGD